MPSSLSKISSVPGVDTDIREYWRVLAPLCQMYNALLNWTVRSDTGKEDVTITESNAMLEYLTGSDGGGRLVFAGMSAGALKYYSVVAEEVSDGTGAIHSP